MRGDRNVRGYSHRTVPPHNEAGSDPAASPTLQHILNRMLAKAPADRFGEPKQAADALAAFLRGAQGPETGPPGAEERSSSANSAARKSDAAAGEHRGHNARSSRWLLTPAGC